MGILARLGFRAPEQTTPTTPPAGQRALYAKSTGWYDLNSAGVETALGGGGSAAPIPTNYVAPTGAAYETFTRHNNSSGGTLVPQSGVVFLVAIALPVGLSVGHIAFVNNPQAAVAPTNWWFGLYDSNHVQLATTAGQLTAAWPSSTLKSLPIATTAAGAASSYITTYTGLHYLGFSMSASTMVSLIAGTGVAEIFGQAPILSGNTDPSKAAPPAFPFTARAISASTSLPYAYVGP